MEEGGSFQGNIAGSEMRERTRRTPGGGCHGCGGNRTRTGERSLTLDGSWVLLLTSSTKFLCALVFPSTKMILTPLPVLIFRYSIFPGASKLFLEKDQTTCILGFVGLSLCHMTQLCCRSLKAATASKGMNGRGCVANSLWTLKF